MLLKIKNRLRAFCPLPLGLHPTIFIGCPSTHSSTPRSGEVHHSLKLILTDPASLRKQSIIFTEKALPTKSKPSQRPFPKSRHWLLGVCTSFWFKSPQDRCTFWNPSKSNSQHLAFFSLGVLKRSTILTCKTKWRHVTPLSTRSAVTDQDKQETMLVVYMWESVGTVSMDMCTDSSATASTNVCSHSVQTSAHPESSTMARISVLQ